MQALRILVVVVLAGYGTLDSAVEALRQAGHGRLVGFRPSGTPPCLTDVYGWIGR